VFIGHEAIDAYYRENVGRPSRLVRERVGEIEITQSDVGSVKGYPVGPQTYVRDVYVLVDELTPGRLLHSLKSGLATGYEGTVIFGRHYSLDALIAAYLREIRDRIQVETGEIAKDVVMGRPVNFVNSTSEADNQRALARLRSAALKAGFVDIDFEFEPVAAALFYELNLGESQNIVVFDLGGGTLDITVMHVGGDRSRRRVLSTGGVGIAGDSFDQRIINWRILDHFGRGSTWGENGKPFPSQYTAALADWQTVTELLQPETLHFLRIAQLTSSHPKQIRALESLLINNYAVRLFDEVERAKIALSSQMFEVIQLQGDDIDLWQPITRSQFEAIIVNETHVIESCLLDTMERSGLQTDEIDAVVRTGGSAQIPRFIDLLGRIFGAEKVVHTDMFGGVAAGLAIRARQETE
ncbi:MAG: Hsp70 family protein, partial [Anaerolineae bacterium]